MSASKTRAAFALSGAWLLAVRSALLRRKCVPICLSWLLAAGASSPGAAELLTAQFCASAMTSVQAATSDRLRSDEASRETIRGDLHVMMGHLTDGTTYTTYELLNIERLTESRSIPLRAARSIQLSAVTLHGWEEFEIGSPQPARVTVEGYWQRDGTFLVSELV
ncbi:MAG: hypothetical protein ACYTKC_20480, partial [Planctomycetota bacterium]